MSETPRLETKQPIDILAQLKSDLGAEESLARVDLHQALVDKGISTDTAGAYEKLEPRSGHWRWPGLISALIAGTYTLSSLTRLYTEKPGNWQEGIRILLDNAVAWAGTSIGKLELTSIILGASAALFWTLVPPKIYEGIFQRETRRSVLADEHREGRANLAGKLGPNIHIDVGKSDPSALLLTGLFHLTGQEVVTFWDENNANFSENPYWQRTKNDWTNRKTLIRGDIQETKCSVVLVSNADDVFLSKRKQDSDPEKKQFQDMTDDEAIGTVGARDSARKKMGLPPIQHIIVTNPKRIVEIDVARHNNQPYQPKTVGAVLEEAFKEKGNVHLIDPDQLIIQELANLAAADNLPLELVTNKERRKEYEGYLSLLIGEYNRRDGEKSAEKAMRIAEEKDGENTLSVIYGTDDEATIATVQGFGREFSQHGKMVAVINDPDKVSRLPEGTNYICVGSAVAEAVYEKFSNLVAEGKIELA